MLCNHAIPASKFGSGVSNTKFGLRANGVVFEGHGIPPHIFSTPSLADLRQGRDAALEVAKNWLLSGDSVAASKD